MGRTFSVTQSQLCRRKVERRDGNAGTSEHDVRLQLQISQRFFVAGESCPSKLVPDLVCRLLRVFCFYRRDSVETSQPLRFLGWPWDTAEHRRSWSDGEHLRVP